MITVFGFIGYEFYISLTGGNSGFSKTVEPIDPDLGVSTLGAIRKLDESVPVRDEALNNK